MLRCFCVMGRQKTFDLPLVGEGFARNPQNSHSLVSGNPTRSSRIITMLLYLKRASNARPYKSVSKYLVGATIGRPHNNDVTLLWNGGSAWGSRKRAKRVFGVPSTPRPTRRLRRLHLIRQSPEILRCAARAVILEGAKRPKNLAGELARG